jgi:SAM-dependent methyltransferase
MSSKFASLAKRSMSSSLLAPVKRLVRPLIRNDHRIPIGSVRWGDFRRDEPICSNFGYSRGKPVDRYYIESFIGEHADDISGRILEIKNPTYTSRFGASRVKQVDVLDIDATNPAATIVADLNNADAVASAAYDCVIFTQTLQYMFDPAKVLRHLHRSLKVGGVLLLTAPGITPVRECGADWYWNFTRLGVERLLRKEFGPSVAVHSSGNLVSATAFLHGMSAAELTQSELAQDDPAYQLLILARAVKAQA